MAKNKTLVIVGVAGASLVLYGLWKYFQNGQQSTVNSQQPTADIGQPTVDYNTPPAPSTPLPPPPPITWERNLYTAGENKVLDNTLTRLISAIELNNTDEIELQKRLLLRRLENYAIN